MSAKFADVALGSSNFTSFKDPMKTLSTPFDKKHIGVKEKVVINKEGKGRLYYATRVSYAPQEKFDRRNNAGIDIRKEYHVERNGKWEKLESPFKLKRGEIVRADIYASVPVARNFVVINDPIPGGLEAVNRDLANSSQVDSGKGKELFDSSSWYFKFSDWRFYNVSRWSFYHRELRHNAAVFYSEYLGPGNYHVSYVAQVIAEGTFAVQPVHAEEMYDPDVLGKGLTGTMKVNE